MIRKVTFLKPTINSKFEKLFSIETVKDEPLNTLEFQVQLTDYQSNRHTIAILIVSIFDVILTGAGI